MPFPPDPNPRPPGFDVPDGSWDTHFHLFGPPHRFPYAEDRLRTPLAAPIEHWWSTFARIGITCGVTVTPGIHGNDNRATLDAIERSAGRLRGVVRSNAELTRRAAAELHRHGIRGMRFAFVTRRNGNFDEAEVRANLPQIAPHGWVASFLIDGEALQRHAETIAALPVPAVIDGLAGMSSREGIDQPAARTLRDLLQRPNVHWKIMSVDRELHAGGRYDDVVALVRSLIDAAPDHVIWGSDWPHSYHYEAGHIPNDGALLGMLADFAPDPAVRRKILVDNPSRLYGFD